MILFFIKDATVYAVKHRNPLSDDAMQKLEWLFGGAVRSVVGHVEGYFIGPRKEMVTPWSTNAVEITQNMGISGIERMEEFHQVDNPGVSYDRMLLSLYHGLDQEIFTIDRVPEPTRYIDDIAAYNQAEGLALSDDEIEYLYGVSRRIGRKLTDSEVYGFAQINSEHCRHKIFNGTFIIDGQTMPESLFALIKKTTRLHPNRVVSAYSDNVAFIEGPIAWIFAPLRQHQPDYFTLYPAGTVISLKAETHNFPTTVEPFNGAATGTGGEIRDRMAGGKGSMPLAGTAVYMTAYPRMNPDRRWEKIFPERPWRYQTPLEILIKASNGASDFGNKFGQPLICGSLLTFEYQYQQRIWGYDKVVMLAGGIGYALRSDARKETPVAGDQVIVMGGDNYRIGMGGGAVSSVATGQYDSLLELNAVQRSNPEMQKRVYNTIRAMIETGKNPIVSIHDHGAGGHLNSLSELAEQTGATIDMDCLPVGDPTLSDREILGNESQERMGLILHPDDVETMQKVAERERAPFYVVGTITGNHRLTFTRKNAPIPPVDLEMADLFGNPPRTTLEDQTTQEKFPPLTYDPSLIADYLEQVLQLEAVACKDWLTNKVDRSVTGRIAAQQCTGVLQLPLSNYGISALDYQGFRGVATSIGHAPAAGLIDPANGPVLAIAEALTNLVWVPIEKGLQGVSLSANWMWPARNPGENARLYRAVKAASDFAIALGINIPTGKDSLSMTQKYPDGLKVFSPGTVIISTVAEVSDFRMAVGPVLRPDPTSRLLYIPFTRCGFELGGSSLAQTLGQLGHQSPAIDDPAYFARAFGTIQQLINERLVLSGHDVSAGGLITTLLEMNFANLTGGLKVNLTDLGEPDPVRLLFSEKPAIVIQVQAASRVMEILRQNNIMAYDIGMPVTDRKLTIVHQEMEYHFDIDRLRDIWFRTSYLLDRHQTREDLARDRMQNYHRQPLDFRFPSAFQGKFSEAGIDPCRTTPSGIRAAIIREKGVNGDREMAWSLYLAGFDVKDVHTTDLISGREDLEDVQFIVFVGGFSNSDVLGSGKGWAGALLFNEKARTAITRFYQRQDTLSLGICNGCQVMTELGLIYPDHAQHPKMLPNLSGKFESAFLTVEIVPNHSVMLGSLSGCRLGVWIAHGEGRFSFPLDESHYRIPVKYLYPDYPGNPNGSPFAAAAIVSDDGRHLAMMPHPERAVLPWQWAFYPENRKHDDFSPWLDAFINAREWIKQHAR